MGGEAQGSAFRVNYHNYQHISGAYPGTATSTGHGRSLPPPGAAISECGRSYGTQSRLRYKHSHDVDPGDSIGRATRQSSNQITPAFRVKGSVIRSLILGGPRLNIDKFCFDKAKATKVSCNDLLKLPELCYFQIKGIVEAQIHLFQMTNYDQDKSPFTTRRVYSTPESTEGQVGAHILVANDRRNLTSYTEGKEELMAPKKIEEPERKPLIGRVGTNLKVGIVGIPNVGKSTFFNVLTKSQAAAENFPFCTIDPNENNLEKYAKFLKHKF
ncbi:hypothetical protein WN51_12952 [Melipona quadrifasciata]|uniref:OBG-type G domain-containing protein n=1 Tax=Melipona quadrifasciata TaxID=166423 RepID=A0A0M9ACR0_9HYME|nr:hypothetical protein WN51_12952 [Melipona quadrifasciata]